MEKHSCKISIVSDVSVSKKIKFFLLLCLLFEMTHLIYLTVHNKIFSCSFVKVTSDQESKNGRRRLCGTEVSHTIEILFQKNPLYTLLEIIVLHSNIGFIMQFSFVT